MLNVTYAEYPHMLSVVAPSASSQHAEHHYPECHGFQCYADCHYSKCRCFDRHRATGKAIREMTKASSINISDRNVMLSWTVLFNIWIECLDFLQL
jgi:hypothetical protein